MNKNKKHSKKSKENLKFSKIDLIVPYEDDLDYIKDYDGDYGFDNVRFRFEFEMSPDGKHIIRPVSEVNPHEINATHELLTREAKLLGECFGYNKEQIKILFKEFYKIVFLWYTVLKYPLKDLRYLVKIGYFKHPEEIVDFVILHDDFNVSDEVLAYVYKPYMDGVDEKYSDEEEDQNLDENEEENNFKTLDYDSFEDSKDDSKLINILSYDKEKEYQLLERLSEINKKLKSESLSKEERERLTEEKKAIASQIRKMREEFLAECGLTYEEFVLLRRAKHYETNWGYVKYPLYEEEEKDKWDLIEEQLFQKAVEYGKKIELIRQSENSNTNLKEELQKLIEKRNKILSSLEKIKWKRMNSEEKKAAKIHKIIEKIYTLGKDKNILAYKLSLQAKEKIKTLRSYGRKQCLYTYLNQVWQKRKERFENLFPTKCFSTKQLALFSDSNSK
ncbi:MAG: hypothetical protein ACP5QP_01765 [Brevinematia bacterium]